MELESLKYAWHTLSVRPLREQTREEILASLHRRSRGPVARMRRNLIGELALYALAYIPSILFYMMEFGGKLREIAGLLLFVAIFFAGYYYRMNRLLKGMQCLSCAVKSNLERHVLTLRRYIRIYKIAGTLMIPLVVIISLLIIRWKNPSVPGSDLYYRLSGYPWWKSPVSWVLVLVPLTIGIYFLNGWYVNRLYGRHIRQLIKILEEMSQE